MGSAVSGLGSYDPSKLNELLTPTASSANSVVKTSGVSAKQELAAMRENGDLESVLSDSIAAGVLQVTYPSTTSPVAATDVSSLVNQLIAAYSTPADGTSASGISDKSAAALPTNPALAIIQALENAGLLGSLPLD